MKSLINSQAPQPTSPAHPREDSPKFHLGTPTLLGTPPPGMERRFTAAPLGVSPEWMKLPAPRERCPLTGASRSWILDQEKLGRVKVARVRQPGRMRGACFVYVPSLLALLRGELEKQTTGANPATADAEKGGHDESR